MIYNRLLFGLCTLNHTIFVVGGICQSHLYSCERYHILKNHWAELPLTCKIPSAYSVGISCVTVRKRFIFGFGGCNQEFHVPESEIIYRLDTLKLQTGW